MLCVCVCERERECVVPGEGLGREGGGGMTQLPGDDVNEESKTVLLVIDGVVGSYCCGYVPLQAYVCAGAMTHAQDVACLQLIF